MLVIAAPGQGAQVPGFLAPWLDLPGVADRLTAWSDLAGCDLIACGTTAGAEEITDTAIAQPLLVASGIAAALALFPHPAEAFRQVGAAAGHSVGELTAAAGTGAITAEQGGHAGRFGGRRLGHGPAADADQAHRVLRGENAGDRPGGEFSHAVPGRDIRLPADLVQAAIAVTGRAAKHLGDR